MSRSPRRLLRRASEALDALRDVQTRYPDARAELDAALGTDGTARLAEAAAVIRAAADALQALPPPGTNPNGAP